MRAQSRESSMKGVLTVHGEGQREEPVPQKRKKRLNGTLAERGGGWVRKIYDDMGKKGILGEGI